MDVKRLRLFVILAEELHFSRAAKRAAVAQSVLSVQIKRLEDEVGSPLFLRTKRTVRLSEVGRRFVPEARGVLDRLERAKRVATALGGGKAQILRVGVTTVAMLGAAPSMLGAVRDQHPHVEIDIRELGTADQESALAERAIDVGFLHPPLDHPEHRTMALTPSRFVALERRSAGGGARPASTRQWDELIREPIVFFGRRRAPRLYDAFISAAHAAGVTPDIRAEAGSFLAAVGAAAAGVGAAIVPEELRACAPSQLVATAIEDCPLSLLNGVTTRADSDDPVVDALMRRAAEAA